MTESAHDAALRIARGGKLAGVFASLRDRGAQGVSPLAKSVGLSRPTVTSLLAELADAGLVTVDDEAISKGGRPASRYRFNAGAAHALAVDFLRNSLAIAICSLDGTIVHASAQPAPFTEGAEERFRFLVAAVDDALDSVGLSRGSLRAATVATTGTMDASGTIQRSFWVPAWEGFELGDRLRAEWPFAVRVENDVNCAAFGELALRPTLPTRDLLYIKFNPRATMGLVLDGQIHRGAANRAGELPDLLGELLVDDKPDGHRLEQAIALAAAVVDPSLVVLESTRDDTGEWVSRVRSGLEELIPPSGRPIVAEGGLLSQSASLVGALSMALESATALMLDGASVPPPPLKKLDDLRHALRAGGHAAHLAGAEDLAGAPQVRIGVVGVAQGASRLARWVENPANNGLLVGFRAPDVDAPERASALAHRKVTVHPTLPRLLDEGLDAAIVATDDAQHAEAARVLLEAGASVLVEEPVALTIEAASKVLKTAAASARVLMVTNPLRESVVLRTMRDMAARGTIGEITGICHRHLIGRGDALRTVAARTREIDVIHWLTDSHAVDVVAMSDASELSAAGASWLESDGDTVAARASGRLTMVLLRLSSGALASMHEVLHVGPEMRHITLEGTTGRLEFVSEPGRARLRLWGQGADASGTSVADEADRDDVADERILAGFLRQVRAGEPHRSPVDAWHALAVSATASESARAGSHPRSVPELEPALAEHFLGRLDAGRE